MESEIYYRIHKNSPLVPIMSCSLTSY